MTRFAAVSPQLLVQRLLAEFEARHPGSHPLRVAVDAPRCADLSVLLQSLEVELPATGRPLAVVRAPDFYRDASLRLEYGKNDVESFYTGWLDVAALQREVLVPLLGDAGYLPSLRDPVSNRATRAEPVPLAGRGVLLVVGELLLGTGLGFDLTVHVALSRQARKRLMPPSWQWTLPAFDRYDIEVDPSALADVVIRYDDPLHPALSVPAAR